ncbi:MAG: PAS domain-containing protein [Rubrivivax sp.]|nr:PAS domain-containing protein [Rubrivivax sp.]
MSPVPKPPRSLQARVTLVALALVLLTAGAIAGLASWALQADIEALVGQQQATSVKLLAQQFENELHSRLRTLERAAGLYAEALASTPEALQPQLRRSPLLDLFNAGCFVTGTDGRTLADSLEPPRRLDLNYADRDYIAAALKEGRASIGRLVVGRALGKPVLAMGAPVRSPDGQILGALACITDLDAPNFLDRISGSSYGRTGGFALIDLPHRVIVTGTDRSRIAQPLPPPGSQPLLDRMLAGELGASSVLVLNEREVVAAAYPIAGKRWALAVFLPTEEAFEPARRMTLRVWLAAAVAVVLAGLWAWWLMRRQMAPMAEAVQALESRSGTAQPLAPLPVSRDDELGRLIGSFNRVLDTLAQREHALTQSRELLATVVDSVPVRIFWKDRELRYLGCNRAFAADAGRASPADMLGRTDFEMAWASQAEAFRADDEAVIRSGVPKLDFEEDSVGPDGRQLTLRTSKVPLKRADGAVIGVLGVYQDVSEQRQVANELARHRNHLEEMVAQRTAELQAATSKLASTQFAMDSVGIGITWVDVASGRHLYANAQAAQMLGYTVDELLARHVWDIDPNFPQPTYREAVEHIRAAGFARFETTQTTRDGAALPVEITIYHQAARAGLPPILITFCTDVSARREQQQALLRAKEAAEAASVAKSAFLANMSHEIRTPLNAVIGLADVLRRGQVSDAQREQLAKIDSAGRHLLSLINDVLDLAKIEAGRLEIAQQDFHLGALMDSVLAMVRGAAAQRGLALSVDVGTVPAWLNGDPVRLRQALLNFAGNAVKFTERGSVLLKAEVESEAGDGLVLRFEVCDTGIGVAQDKLPLLFHEFEQADASLRRRFSGTGLGLAITRRLAQLMGGEVGVSSTLGQGSRFWFTARLRRGQGELQAPPTEAADEHDTFGQLASLQARVLLAEDNPVNREVTLSLLDGSSLVVDVAADGVEAVQLASQRRYDLVLMDMQMPRMDGLAATLALRRLPGWATVPIVALTANAFAEDRRACLDAGMNDFMAKPVSSANLYAVLLRWLVRTGDAGGATTPEAGGAATPATEAADGVLRRLAGLERVDVARGVAALLGRRDRYVDLVGRFLRSQRPTLGQIEAALVQGDLAAARFSAHSLKGAAATLGFDGLSALLAEFEQDLRDTDPGAGTGPPPQQRLRAIGMAFESLEAALVA